MALFDESNARDPFGYLGLKNKPTPTSIGSLVSGDNVSNKSESSSTLAIEADPSSVSRKSVDAFAKNKDGILAHKLDTSKSDIYKSNVTKSSENKDSKISTDIDSRINDPYDSGSAQTPDKKYDIEKLHNKTKFTGPTPPTKDSGNLANAVREFQENYDLTLTSMNINQTSQQMLNGTKDKKVLSILAGGNSEMLSSLGRTPATGPQSAAQLMKSEQDRRYYDELGKKYEDKYADNKYALRKKKLPDYSSTQQVDRIDQYNRQGVSDNNIRSEFSLAEDDMIPLYFHDLVNKKFIPFRALITDVSESSDANWSEVRYLGRADAVQIYSGFTRTLSVGFNVQAFSIEELHPMWQRINHLVGLTKPATYSGDLAGNSSKLNSFIIPPFVKFRLGDMYRNQPVIITTIGTTVPPEASWELVSNERGTSRDYEYLNGTIKRENVKSAQYPTLVTINVGMTLLEKRAPETIARHFGDSSVERDNGLDDVSIEGGDFNHQLIH